MRTTTIARLAQFLAIFTLSLLPVGSTRAQEEKQDWSPPKPTAQHKLLQKDAGTWDAIVKVYPMEDADPIESKGVEKNELLKGGMWLTSHFDGEAAGTPFSGVGTTGYDPIEKKYVGTWVDSMTPHLLVWKGDYDEKTKTLTAVGESRDPYMGKPYKTKLVTHYNDDGTRVFEMHAPGPDGKQRKMMEIEYKRRAD
jgi:hypothetical protein